MKKLLLILTVVLPLQLANAAELIVSAASSLTNAMQDVGKAFESQNKADKVIFSFAGSGVLLQQIELGAPADVFASADLATMARSSAKGLMDNASISNFAANQLVLVQASNSKKPLTADLQQLLQQDIRRLAVGKVDTVPVGSYSKDLLLEAKLWDKLQDKIIWSDNVRQVLDYVARGEVDAGFVYATDAKLRSDKVTIIAAYTTKRPLLYPVGIVKTSKQPQLAQRFIDFLKTDTAQQILQGYGFAKP